MNRLLLKAALIPVLISLLGLHGRGRGKRKRSGGEGGHKSRSKHAEEELDKGDVDKSGAPADDTSQNTDTDPTPPKKEPKFEFDEDMVDATWEKHRPGGYYDRKPPPDDPDQPDPKNNVYDKNFTKDDLRAALQDAQQNGVERPRGVNTTDLMRSGKYVYWNSYTDKKTGLKGQTGLLIPIAGDGNMKTAYPFDS